MKIASRIALCAALLVAGCAGSHGSTPQAGARMPLREPYVAMTGTRSGVLVWPSGSNWVLLSTTDGFAHEADRSPPAVDTGGGLAVGLDEPRAAVGIGAVERLVRSPMVIARSRWRWQPDEVPGAIANSRGSVAANAGSVYVVLRDGRVVAQTGHRWRTLTTSARLAGDGGFAADSIVWHGGDGILTGHGRAGRPMAYRTADRGHRWTAVAGTSGTGVAALPPCGDPAAPSVPVIDGSGDLRVVDAQGRPGSAVHVGGGDVTLGCAGHIALVVDAGGQLAASTDGGRNWSVRGAAPGDLTALAPTGGGTGFATSGGAHPRLWRFTDQGERFTEIPLPGWVAQLGSQGGSD